MCLFIFGRPPLFTFQPIASMVSIPAIFQGVAWSRNEFLIGSNIAKKLWRLTEPNFVAPLAIDLTTPNAVYICVEPNSGSIIVADYVNKLVARISADFTNINSNLAGFDSFPECCTTRRFEFTNKFVFLKNSCSVSPTIQSASLTGSTVVTGAVQISGSVMLGIVTVFGSLEVSNSTMSSTAIVSVSGSALVSSGNANKKKKSRF